ncbi:hypothetical protein IFM89_021794 [Coptis chinensis]|uniref:GDSL esterase/lipase n=1 Tax=Coptis chinensis TaxID=261450 RepID=A0A835M6X3_9MAGN|nr:hypothetical protein IFM89_021794 [Coptis chinensis]
MAERLVFISSFLCVISLSMVANAAVPAVFIFGDSTADVGTNNYIKDSKAKANFPQNGIDFPGSVPTGRFSNGLNTADFLAQQMGFRRSPPPFFTLMKEKLRLHKHVLRGVNFASGGSGLMDVTGIAPYGKVLPMSKQIQQFATVHNIIKEFCGEEATDSILSRSPFFISVGSNDLFEYFALNNGTSNKQEYITILKSAYEKHLRSAKLCSNRDEYLFWDLYHPTQAAAKLAARTLYEGGPEFVTPINFKELAEAN